MADKDAVSDDSVDLKKRARRRLVGAAALALLAIIVLPMVMDREPRSVSQDIQIRIPSQEVENLPARTPVKTAGATTSSIQTPTAATVEPVAPEIKADAEKNGPQKVDVAKPVVHADEGKVVEPPVAEKPKLAERISPQKVEEDRATAALEGRNGAQWVVQLGAYQNVGNAKLLLAKIKEMNIPAYSEKLDTPQGSRVRVRAGPFSSKDMAEKAQSKIRKIGVEGPVAQK